MVGFGKWECVCVCVVAEDDLATRIAVNGSGTISMVHTRGEYREGEYGF